jgi:hypothetical protein
MTPLTIPTNAATTMATAAVEVVMCIETGNPIPGRARKRMAMLASTMPSNPPIKEMATDSLKSNFRILSLGKAESAEHGDFAGAFADRHGHGVGTDE